MSTWLYINKYPRQAEDFYLLCLALLLQFIDNAGEPVSAFMQILTGNSGQVALASPAGTLGSERVRELQLQQLSVSSCSVLLNKSVRKGAMARVWGVSFLQ